MQKTNMYANTKTWNPFKGCGFACTYCKPSFQQQAKRQLHNCKQCYDYTPHEHPERLTQIPAAPTVFVAGNGDIAFASLEYRRRIVNAIIERNERRAKRRCQEVIYYLQSKAPRCLEPLLPMLPANVVLVSTLETNRDKGYRKISKAPRPSVRYAQFLTLDYPRKIVTIEPIMDFDLDEFAEMLIAVAPEAVYIGYNSRPGNVNYPEPSLAKTNELIRRLEAAGIEVRLKTMRAGL